MSKQRLNPQIVVNEKRHLLATERMAAVPIAEIGELIADMTSQGDEIATALDFLFQGFKPYACAVYSFTKPS